MAFTTLLSSVDASIGTITINRPDKLNALNRQTLSELHIAFDQMAADKNVRVVILTGAGNKAFVAGADISEMNSLSPVQARDFSRLGQRLMQKIERMNKPVIGAINGFALGGGMELAMACHIRLGAENAKLGQPEVNLGLIPGFGGTQRLLRICGRAAALELCLLGTPINAERAYQLGLLSKVVPADQLAAESTTMAEHLSTLAPQALRGVIDAIVVGGESGLDVGLDYETQAFAIAFSTQDMKEGTDAFLNKRKPSFKGV
jgi:enoyl-CoA hydratase